MSKTIMKYLLALCLICNVGNVFAQHRYYCEVKGIEKDLSSGLKSYSILAQRHHITFGEISAAN